SVGSKSTFSGAKSSAGTNRRRPIFQLDDATRFSMALIFPPLPFHLLSLLLSLQMDLFSCSSRKASPPPVRRISSIEHFFCCFQERNEQARFIELAKSSSFCSKVYSEIEEIGWEHLVNFSGDLTFLSFRIVDKNQRVHVVGIQLDETYPKSAPSVSADVPYVFNVKWSMNSRLKDLMLQFSNHFEKLEEFWSTLEDIDNSLYVVNAEQSSRSMPFRQIDTGNDCFIMLSIDPRDPKSLPECRFLGSGHNVDHLQKLWQTNSKKW
ncbi:E3 ubiquitin-protein ligase FANCL, partial [Linum perenne]